MTQKREDFLTKPQIVALLPSHHLQNTSQTPAHSAIGITKEDQAFVANHDWDKDQKLVTDYTHPCYVSPQCAIN